MNCNSANTAASPGTPAAYARDLTARLAHAFEAANNQSTLSKLQKKQYYDRKSVFHPHNVGDLVLLDDPAQTMNKLAPRWKGPFQGTNRMAKDGVPDVSVCVWIAAEEYFLLFCVHVLGWTYC